MIYDVICDGCGLSYHETRPGYDKTKPAKGSDFSLKEPWRSAGWSSFPENDDSEYATLECPGCGTLYGNGSGFPRLQPRESEQPQFICDECFRPFESERAMKAHIRMAHKVAVNG